LSNRKNKNLIGLVVGLVVSALIIWFLFRDLNWENLRSYFKSINLYYLPVVWLIAWSGYWIRAARWKLLLPSEYKCSLRELYQATALGIFASWILPLRAGEFIRPWALSRKGEISFSAALASIVVERVFDVLALLILVGICVPQIEDIPPLVSAGSYVLGAIAGAISLVMIAAYISGEWLNQTLDKTLGLFFSEESEIKKKILSMAQEFTTGLSSINSATEFAKVILFSGLLWLSFVGIYWSCLWCFSEFTSPFTAALLTVMVALAIAAPSGPGFVGTFQFGCVLALTNLSDYPKEFSLAYSVFVHAVQVAVGVVLGLLVLKQLNLNFSALTASLSQKKPAEEAS